MPPSFPSSSTQKYYSQPQAENSPTSAWRPRSPSRPPPFRGTFSERHHHRRRQHRLTRQLGEDRLRERETPQQARHVAGACNQGLLCVTAERITLRNHHEPLFLLLLRDEEGTFVCQSVRLARVQVYVRFRGRSFTSTFTFRGGR